MNNENIKLLDCSVIIPTYGQSRLLCETILKTQNIFEQLKLSYEIIIIDDYSSINILEPIKNCLNDNLKIYRLEKNTGQLIATIIGLKLCQGKVIITLDDDMQYHPQYIAEGIARLQNGVSIIYGIVKNEKRTVNAIYKKIASVLMFPRFINYEVSSFRIIDRNVLSECSEVDVIGRFWKVKNSNIGTLNVTREDFNPKSKTIIGLLKHQSFFLASFLKRLLVLILILFIMFSFSHALAIIVIFVGAQIVLVEYSIAKRLRSSTQRLFP